MGIVFPLKKRYDESNLTLEGVEAEHKHWGPFAALEEHHDPPEGSTDPGAGDGVADDAVLQELP
eukprot:10739095-Lingulodinium_polyedra.AAC.1